MSKYPKAKMPDYGDGPEPCEDCAYKDKRITELEDLNTELTDTYNKHMQSWADKYNLLEELIVEAAEPIAILAKDERDAGRYELSRDLFKLVDRMEKYRPIQMPEGGGVCKWICKDSDILLYGGTCGTEWIFDEPPVGDYNYCPKCGKPIRMAEGGRDDATKLFPVICGENGPYDGNLPEPKGGGDD